MSEPEPSHPALRAARDLDASPAQIARISAGAWARVERAERRRRWLRLAVPAAGLAAAGALVWLSLSPTQGPAPPAPAPAALTARRAPAAPHGPTSSALADGSTALGEHRATPKPGAKWRVTAQLGRGRRIALDAGEVAFQVAPLQGDDAFWVETPHAAVRVVGTRFTVAVEVACTTVSVQSGVVQVTGHGDPRALRAGDTSRTCAPAPIEAPSAAQGQAWVQEALGLIGQRQRLPHARALMERYWAAFPQGPLAQEALYYAARLALEAGDPTAARAHAVQFLARFPESHRSAWLRAHVRGLPAID